MPLSLDQLLILPLGYLSGANLARWCSSQLLIKQQQVDPNSLQDSCNLAYSAVTSKLINRYDMKREMANLAPLQGTAVAVLTAGVVTAVNLVNAGGKYSTAPAVTLTGAHTNPAVVTAIITDNVLTGFTIADGGTGYTGTPIIGLAGGLAPDPREPYLVQLVSIMSVRNIMGNAQNVSDYQMGLFKQTEKDLLDIRIAQMNLALYPVPVQVDDPTTGQPFPYPESDALLVRSSFNYLG